MIDDTCDPLLVDEGLTRFRAIVARANFLSADRPDIAYSVKEAARNMTNPKVSDWGLLTRLARYLKGKPRLTMWSRFQDGVDQLASYTDTDWAGCRATRRSINGGLILRGQHILTCWSKTQLFVALSSAEAELHGSVKITAGTIGAMSLMTDLGVKLGGLVLTDASATLYLIRKKRLGQTPPHTDT